MRLLTHILYLSSIDTLFLRDFFFPGSTLNIGPFTGLAEIFFLLWLLIKGVNVEQWERRTLESA